MNKDIIIYEITIDDDPDTGMFRNSFVSTPAVEYTKFDFKKEDNINMITFSEDVSEQRFMSVSMVADTPIPRLDQLTGEIYGIVFTKDNIRKIMNKFVIGGNINEVSFQHTDQIIPGIYLTEHFITKKGVSEAPIFKDLPEGSWVTSYYVPDTELYNKLKADESFNGFSIEISGMLEEQFSRNPIEDLYEEINSILDSCLLDEEMYKLIENILNKD